MPHIIARVRQAHDGSRHVSTAQLLDPATAPRWVLNPKPDCARLFGVHARLSKERMHGWWSSGIFAFCAAGAVCRTAAVIAAVTAPALPIQFEQHAHAGYCERSCSSATLRPRR